MNDENDESWLRSRMQKLRESRDSSAPAFEHVWRRALARNGASTKKMASPAWRLAGVCAAAVVILVTAIFWSSAQQRHNRRVERDFAAVEGTLLTYWQAPSDGLFPTADGNEPPER